MVQPRGKICRNLRKPRWARGTADGEFLLPNPLNAVEDHFRKSLQEKFEGRHLIAARFANLTKSTLTQLAQPLSMSELKAA